MKLAAASAIAGLVSDEDLNENNIMPEAFDPRVCEAVSDVIPDGDRNFCIEKRKRFFAA